MTQPELWEAVEPERAIEVRSSRVLELAGRPLGEGEYPPVETVGETPRTLAELAVFDQVVDLRANHVPKLLPLRQNTRQQVAVVLLLDRCGFLTTSQIARALWPPRATERTVQKSLARMESAGLLHRHHTVLHDNDRFSPALWSLTRAGFELGQNPPASMATTVEPIAEKRRFRASRATRGDGAVVHDLHVINWIQAFNALAPAWVTGRWRTPRYHTGRFRPPLVGSGRARRPVRAADIWLGEGYSFAGIPLQEYAEIVPDACIEVHVVSDPAPLPGPRYDLRFDLLLELDLTRRPAKNEEKLRKYDAFLCGWGLEHQRVKQLRTRPIVVFTSPNAEKLMPLVRLADEILTGRVGALGTPEQEWYYAGRDHILFAVESDVHCGSLRAVKLPTLPAGVRRRLCDDSLTLQQVAIIPQSVINAASNRRP